MTPDTELLHRYAQAHCEQAFAELVRRHIDLVYSTVLRRLHGDTHLAQDAAQTVFTDLARKASILSRRTSLTGWLYTSAHFAAVEMVRKESRRRNREEKFMGQPSSQATSDPNWDELRPVLDDVMLQLKEADREAILLRYFENRPLAEVGAKLGLGENTARMRVERALEKLRALLAKRGIATTSSLVAAISAHAVGIAPAAFAERLAAISMAAARTGTFTLLKIMTATQLKFGLGALLLAGATTALIVQHQTQNRLRAENESSRRQKSAAIAKMQDARITALGDLMYAKDNQGQLAANLAQISSYLSKDPQLLTGTNNFELLYRGSIDGLTNAGTVILLRESQAWTTSGGKWARGYAFADGHCEIHVEPSDNFDAFEERHLVSSP